MALSYALAVVAAAALQTAAEREPAPAAREGAQVEAASVSVRILRPAMVKAGSLVFPEGSQAPHSHVARREGRVTYEFE